MQDSCRGFQYSVKITGMISTLFPCTLSKQAYAKKILDELFPDNQRDIFTYFGYRVYFKNKEDADLFQLLLS